MHISQSLLIVHLLKLVLVCYSFTAVDLSNSRFKCFVDFATRRPPFAYRIALSPRFPGVVVVSNKKTVPKYYSTYQQRLLVANAVNPPLTGVAEHPAFLDNALRLGCCLLNRHGRHLVFRLSRPAAFRMLGDGIVG